MQKNVDNWCHKMHFIVKVACWDAAQFGSFFRKKHFHSKKLLFFAKPAKNEGHISKNLQQSNFPYFGKRNSKLQFSIKNGLTETLIENYFLNEI